MSMIVFFLFVACGNEEKVNTDTIIEEPSDLDNDGYFGSDDCDDNNPAVNIGATEICDGLDNNCDGIIDEGVQNTYYLDADADGFGDSSQTSDACSTPDGYSTTANDCDDQNPDIYPGSDEQCDDLSTTFCASGGAVSGSGIQGVFCFAPLDAAAAPSASNSDLSWQPGPFQKITK